MFWNWLCIPFVHLNWQMKNRRCILHFPPIHYPWAHQLSVYHLSDQWCLTILTLHFRISFYNIRKHAWFISLRSVQRICIIINIIINIEHFFSPKFHFCIQICIYELSILPGSVRSGSMLTVVSKGSEIRWKVTNQCIAESDNLEACCERRSSMILTILFMFTQSPGPCLSTIPSLFITTGSYLRFFHLFFT